jgi:hypothetical protein
MNNIDYQLVEPEIDTNGNPFNPELPQYFQSSYFKGYSFKNYAKYISAFPDESFDVVVIDGRSRPACIVHAISKIKCGGMLILNNSNQAYYLKNTSQLVADWERYNFAGTVPSLLYLEHTSIFIKPLIQVRPTITADQQSIDLCFDINKGN